MYDDDGSFGVINFLREKKVSSCLGNDVVIIDYWWIGEGGRAE